MDNRTFEFLRKYALELSGMESCDENTFKIMVRLDGRVYETADGCDFSSLKRQDVAVVCGKSRDYPAERGLLESREDIRAVVLSCTPYCRRTAELGRILVPALDDMAQIVGGQVRTVDYSEKAVVRSLSRSAACLVRDRGYTITTGRSLYEAVVALTVLEKSAEVNLKAEVLGGAKAIPKAEVGLMRYFYKQKYSKAEQAVKSEEGRG